MTLFRGAHDQFSRASALAIRPQFTLRGPSALPGCGDLCFVWQGSPQSLDDTLAAAGAVIEEGPVPRTGGMNGGSTQGISVYTRDPDANLLEFIIYG